MYGNRYHNHSDVIHFKKNEFLKENIGISKNDNLCALSYNICFGYNTAILLEKVDSASLIEQRYLKKKLFVSGLINV